MRGGDDGSGRTCFERLRPGVAGRGRRLGVLAAALAGLCLAPAADASPSLCVAAAGEVRHQSGTAICEATGTGSVAFVLGDGSEARAIDGDFNRAMVRGDGSLPGQAGAAITTPRRPSATATGGGASDAC